MPEAIADPKVDPKTAQTQPAQAPEPSPPSPPPAPASQKDIDESINDILVGLGHQPPKPKKVETPKPDAPSAKPDEPPAKKDAEPGTPPPEDTGKPPEEGAKPKADDKKPARKRAEPLDAETVLALARDAAHQVVDSIEKPDPAAAQPARATPNVTELDPKEQRRLEVLRRMERENPGKYQGLADKTLKGTLAWREYQQKWELSNPDETFDPEDETHQKIAAKLLPEFDEDDFEEARVTMLAENIVSKKEQERQKQEDKRTADERIKTTVSQAEGEFIRSVDEELYTELSKPEGARKFAETNKVEARVLARNQQKLVKSLTELGKLMDPKLAYESVPGNEIHEELSDFVASVEKQIKSMPADKQFDDQGRRFATAAEYALMNPAQRQRAWIMNQGLIQHLYTVHIADMARSELNEIREYAKSRAGNGKPTASESTPSQKPTPAPAPSATASKPSPPSTASSGDTIKTTDQHLNEPPDLVKTVVESMWR